MTRQPKTTSRKPAPGAKSSGPRHLAAQPAEIFKTAELSTGASIHLRLQLASFDLPLQSRDLVNVAIPEPLSGRSVPGDTDPGTGAVRLALGQAAKRTSGALTKVGSSMKRVFY